MRAGYPSDTRLGYGGLVHTLTPNSYQTNSSNSIKLGLAIPNERKRMATITRKVDDLDEKTEGAETVRFALGDRTFEIDLAEPNMSKLAQALDPFIAKAREITKKASIGGSTQVVRDWLRANGHDIGDKGRIPEDKQALYDAAHANGAAA